MKIKFIKILFESFKGRDREKINYASSYNLPHRGLYDLWQVLRIDVIVIIIMSILPRGRSFTANSGTKAAVLLKGRSYTANSETQAAVLLGMDRCGSFPLLSVPHSRFSIWADLKRSEKAPTWRSGEWIWLTEPSGLHRNSSQGLNISSIKVFDQIRDPEIPITLISLIITITRKETERQREIERENVLEKRNRALSWRRERNRIMRWRKWSDRRVMSLTIFIHSLP